MNSARPSPRLQFRFFGSWHPVLWNDLDSPEMIDLFVAEKFGRRDDHATMRAKARADLRSAVRVAREGDAQAMFLATEIQRGLPMPITLTVFAPPALHISPSIGTSPSAVMDAFRKSLTILEAPELETAEHLEIAGSSILRLHRIIRQPLEDAPGFEAHTLSADYWYTVPGTKRLTLVNIATPLGDMSNLMLSFFDAIITASFWDGE